MTSCMPVDSWTSIERFVAIFLENLLHFSINFAFLQFALRRERTRQTKTDDDDAEIKLGHILWVNKIFLVPNGALTRAPHPVADPRTLHPQHNI